MKIPVILQKVSAGFPSPATDYVQDEIDLNSELIKNPPATFLIRVQGNSMTEHKIIKWRFISGGSKFEFKK
jgi:DNA polymerase V